MNEFCYGHLTPQRGWVGGGGSKTTASTMGKCRPSLRVSRAWSLLALLLSTQGSEATVLSQISVTAGGWPHEISWSLACSDGGVLNGGAPYSSTSSFSTTGDAVCTLTMSDSFGDGSNGEWRACPWTLAACPLAQVRNHVRLWSRRGRLERLRAESVRDRLWLGRDVCRCRGFVVAQPRPAQPRPALPLSVLALPLSAPPLAGGFVRSRHRS